MCLSVYMCMCVSLCVCVCVCLREREITENLTISFGLKEFKRFIDAPCFTTLDRLVRAAGTPVDYFVRQLL